MTTHHAETVDERRRPSAGCCSARSCRSTATPTCSRCTSTPRTPRSTPTSYEIGGNRAAKDLNNAAIRQSTSTGTSDPPRPDRVAHGVPGRSRASGCPSAPTSTPSPRRYWRRWTVVSDVAPDRRRSRAAAPRVTVYKSMANGRSQRVDAATTDAGAARRRPSTSTCRSSRSSTAAGTGTTSSPATRTPSSSRPSGPPRCPPTAREHGTVDIGITTMNRPDFCAKLLGQLGDDETLRPYLDEVLRHGAGHPEGRRLASSSRAPRRRSATSCASSSRATSAAPAATPAASSSRSARAPRRTR